MDRSCCARLIQALLWDLKVRHQETLLNIREVLTKDQAALRVLLSSSSPPTKPTLSPYENAAAELHMFERIASACGLPEEHWGLCIQRLLMGEAQLMVQSLPAERQQHYPTVKSAVLGWVREKYRQQFRSLTPENGEPPAAFAVKLLDSCRKWLQLVGEEAEKAVEQVALEQLIFCLSEEKKMWVQQHQPDTLAAAVKLIEQHMVAFPANGTQTGGGSEAVCQTCGDPGHFQNECAVMEVD